jgi:hypothetical protein
MNRYRMFLSLAGRVPRSSRDPVFGDLSQPPWTNATREVVVENHPEHDSDDGRAPHQHQGSSARQTSKQNRVNGSDGSGDQHKDSCAIQSLHDLTRRTEKLIIWTWPSNGWVKSRRSSLNAPTIQTLCGMPASAFTLSTSGHVRR